METYDQNIQVEASEPNKTKVSHAALETNSKDAPNAQATQSNASNYSVRNTANGQAALYVGDLCKSVTESRLFELFGSCGAVSSIRICRDSETGNSLGYAYVNYHSQADAQRAIENLNFTRLNNREIRIMWAHPDPTLRKSGVGNIFVKNLDESIDNKTLYDTFSVFGTILSSKVAYNSEGRSLGYGFVHYENPRSAENAIRRVNKMEIAQRLVEVCHFKPSNQRNNGEPKFTNVYVKNMNKDDPFPFADEETFRAFFERFGEITSTFFPLNEDGTPRGFAFANYKDPAVAQKVIEEVHDRDPERLYVAKALSKAMRRHNLHEKFLKWREAFDAKTAGRNMYIKNLPDGITDDVLRAEFEKFGPVASAKVRLDDHGQSKGFGFVLFEDAEHAMAAIKSTHGRLWDTKVVFATLWQRKHLLQQAREEQANRNAKYMQQHYPQNMMNQQSILYPTMNQQGYLVQQMHPGMAQQARWPQQTTPRGPYPAQVAIQGPSPFIPVAAYQNAVPIQMQQQYAEQQQQQAFQGAQQQQAFQGAQQQQAFQGALQQQQTYPHAVELTEANAGEMIYKRVEPIAKEDGAKITGMFLEMDLGMLRSIWQSEDRFLNHLNRALSLLQEDRKKKQQLQE